LSPGKWKERGNQEDGKRRRQIPTAMSAKLKVIRKTLNGNSTMTREQSWFKTNMKTVWWWKTGPNGRKV